MVNGTEARAFRTSVRPSLLGEVHCIRTESKLLDHSHSSIGRHWCGHDYTPVRGGSRKFCLLGLNVCT